MAHRQVPRQQAASQLSPQRASQQGTESIAEAHSYGKQQSEAQPQNVLASSPNAAH
jgi:hypothetical protein